MHSISELFNMSYLNIAGLLGLAFSMTYGISQFTNLVNGSDSYINFDNRLTFLSLVALCLILFVIKFIFY